MHWQMHHFLVGVFSRQISLYMQERSLKSGGGRNLGRVRYCVRAWFQIDVTVWSFQRFLQKSPFHKAAYYGETKLAIFLLENNADVSNAAFRDIISEGYE